MRLKKLEVYGFKSFAERMEMTFDDGVTGIVGPNGSGKSNLADAVRWVLGEQSAKSLRGGKMEDVIFNGTAKRRRLAWCEVLLTFENHDRALPVEFTEVSVARRVYRSGASEYLINNSPCRLGDVIDIFRDTGIGKEGYSLIGQGRIDEILSVKSDDRRQVFEEAAGIVKYKARKTEADRRLESTRLYLSRVEDIIAELEARLGPLREQAVAAREHMKLAEEIKRLELNAFIVRNERACSRMSEFSGALLALDDDIKKGELEHDGCLAIRREQEASLTQLEANSARARDNIIALTKDAEAREGDINVLKERISADERERARLEADLQGAECGEEELKRRAAEIEALFEADSDDIMAQRALLNEMDAGLVASVSALDEREIESERLKERVIDAMNSISDARSEQARLNAMRGALEARVFELNNEITIVRDEMAVWQERVERAQAELAVEAAEKDRLDSKLNGIIVDLNACSGRAEGHEADIKSISNALRETASRLSVLEEMQRDYEGYQHAVKQVLMWARRGAGRTGVHGVVAELIGVPRAYERAIDMALGPALQNIVTDREEDAKAMINYLRENKMGRATFLPMSAVRGRTLSNHERENALMIPGCLGVASELISLDPKYERVIAFLLGRTVVAENLDAGIAIHRAGQRAFRVVTLEGDVMHPGGSITGGSNQLSATRLLSRERELSEHREKLNDLTAREAELTARLLAEEDKKTSIKRMRAEAHEQIHQQDIACARAEANKKSAAEGLAAQRERCERFESEQAKAAGQLEEAMGSLERLADQRGGAEQLNTADQADLIALTRNISRDREKLDETRAQCVDMRVKLATRERGLQALKADRSRLAAERLKSVKWADELRAALKHRIERLREGAEQLMSGERALTGIRLELSSAAASSEAAELSRKHAQRQILEMTEQLDKLGETQEALVERRHRTEMQLARVENECRQMQERVWEDYALTLTGVMDHREPDFKLSESEKKLPELRARIRELDCVNMGAVDEYRSVSERFEGLCAQRDDLIKAQMDLQSIIEELMEKMERRFKSQLEALNAYFKETFVALFGGGHAEFQLADPGGALSCDIEVVAQPPGKKLQLLSLLSGGERALAAIAIIFAMLKLKPTPFCMLDEIEAALDDANLVNFANYLRDYSNKTQFVVVTHRKGTMERCDALYGVAMEEKGVSKMVSIKLRDAAG
jgi:chromosome segregation protein